jgi:hypothetical protein
VSTLAGRTLVQEPQEMPDSWFIVKRGSEPYVLVEQGQQLYELALGNMRMVTS